VNYAPYKVSHKPSKVDHKPHKVSHEPSKVDHVPSKVEHALSKVDLTLIVVSHAPIIVTYKPLIKMRLKQEEIVPVADMLIASFERDQAEMEAENSFYSVAFLNQFKTTTDNVRKLEAADVLLTKQKTVTKELYLLADNLYQPLKLFNIVVQKAGMPTNLVPEIITNLKSRNIEGGLLSIKALLQVVSSNKSALESKAMKATFPELLKTNFDALTEKSNLQTKIRKDRKLLTDGNQSTYDALYNDYIIDLCTMGKALYHGKAKAKEYTITNMLKNVHVTRNNKGGTSPTGV
jgi:hypothetical protein